VSKLLFDCLLLLLIGLILATGLGVALVGVAGKGALRLVLM
jgi:hypothetical protein